jgi:hypothetical protein
MAAITDPPMTARTATTSKRRFKEENVMPPRYGVVSYRGRVCGSWPVWHERLAAMF